MSDGSFLLITGTKPEELQGSNESGDGSQSLKGASQIHSLS